MMRFACAKPAKLGVMPRYWSEALVPPTVALVDELAHTNAPGSRRGKRYQDVEDLLRAGVHVVTTMNVQHLESLYDVIERFAGVKVKERVPDYVLAQADQIVNVDVSAEDLQERLRQGKVYPPDRAERAHRAARRGGASGLYRVLPVLLARR